jgi:hypothetical protein
LESSAKVVKKKPKFVGIANNVLLFLNLRRIKRVLLEKFQEGVVVGIAEVARNPSLAALGMNSKKLVPCPQSVRILLAPFARRQLCVSLRTMSSLIIPTKVERFVAGYADNATLVSEC